MGFMAYVICRRPLLRLMARTFESFCSCLARYKYRGSCRSSPFRNLAPFKGSLYTNQYTHSKVNAPYEAIYETRSSWKSVCTYPFTSCLEGSAYQDVIFIEVQDPSWVLQRCPCGPRRRHPKPSD